jgi:hypothetical protein
MCDRNLCGLEARKCIWKKQDTHIINADTNDLSDMDVDSPSESDSDMAVERQKRNGTLVNAEIAEPEKETSPERTQPISPRPSSPQEGGNETMQDQMEEDESVSRNTAQENPISPQEGENERMQDQMEEDESVSRNTAQEWRREIMSSTCKGNEHFFAPMLCMTPSLFTTIRD